jgi:hypothetical protein
MHLDIYTYVYIHNNNYESRFAKTTYNLERREYIINFIRGIRGLLVVVI